MKRVAGTLALVALGALGALLVVGALGLGPGRYTLHGSGRASVRLDRWTGEVASTSDIANATGEQLAACQRDAVAWRSKAETWQMKAQEWQALFWRVTPNPFRRRVEERMAQDSMRTP